MSFKPSAGALFGTGLATLGLALSFLLPAWRLSDRSSLLIGGVILAMTTILFVAAYRRYVSPLRVTASMALVAFEGFFTHDPNEHGEQGIFIRVTGGVIHDVQVLPFGMKRAEVTFDEIRMLAPEDGRRKLAVRPSAAATSVWDAAVLLELAKVQPVRIAMTVKGRPLVVEAPPAEPGRRRMYLRVRYRGGNGVRYINEDHYLQFIDSPRGVPQESRLVVRRDAVKNVAG